MGGGNSTIQRVEQKLVPQGEGWIRHNDDMLVHSQSQVYFVQLGEKAGKYLKRGVGEKWEDVATPHVPRDPSILLRTASASCLRKAGKLDRAVLLNDITKIARLACKIPLAFVERPAC